MGSAFCILKITITPGARIFVILSFAERSAQACDSILVKKTMVRKEKQATPISPAFKKTLSMCDIRCALYSWPVPIRSDIHLIQKC